MTALHTLPREARARLLPAITSALLLALPPSVARHDLEQAARALLDPWLMRGREPLRVLMACTRVDESAAQRALAAIESAVLAQPRRSSPARRLRPLERVLLVGGRR